MNTSGPTDHFLDSEEYDWSKPEALELYGILLRAYGAPSRADMLVATAGIDRSAISFSQPPRDFWKQTLEVAAAARKLRKLAQAARADPSIAAYHSRLDRLVGASPSSAEAPSLSERSAGWGGPELITGTQETFLEMSFLREGLRVAASVVHLGTVTRADASFRATGFLIAPDTVLTNHHVLHDGHGDPVKQVDIWFNYELDLAGRPRDVESYEGDVESIRGDARHDWAILRTKKPFKGAYPLFKLCPSKPVATGDFVFIVQHPAGRPKKIGLLHNEVVNVTPDRVQYLTDTLPGSSGSPVCNELWEVVALHHTGIAADPAKGTLCKNQGININRVVEGLSALGIALKPATREG
jgi:V8-like Glu-specific endopeptidase